MRLRITQGISLLFVGFLLFVLSACGGGGNGNGNGDGDVIDPDTNQPEPADVIFKGRIDLVPEIEVRFVDKNLRSERLSDNPLSEDPIFELIQQAQKSLDIAVMRINRQDVVEALLQQAQVAKIRIVTEKSYYTDPNYKPFYDQLEDPARNNGNIDVRTDLEGAPRMMHSRFMIIDNTRTVLGSYDWSAAGATNSIGDVVIVKDSRITGAFKNQFEQMYTEQLFGTSKRDATQHTWQVGGGYGRVDVYFGPTDDVRSLVENQIASSDYVGFNTKEFADIDFANFLLNWTFGTDPFSGDPREMAGIINDIGIETTPEERAIYQALYERIVGVADTQGGLGLLNSSINSSNPYATTVSNHKYLICDREGMSIGDDPPCVITGSANWTTSSFDFNDECVIILHGNPLTSAYLGYVNPFNPSFQDFDGEVRPEDFGEFVPNMLAYPNAVSPSGAIEQHNVPMGIVYGILPNFKSTVIMGVGTGTEPPPEMNVDILFEISGTTYLDSIIFDTYEIDNFDPVEATNPVHGYVIFVPAGQITISPILLDASSNTRIQGANNPTFQVDLGPGAVRRRYECWFTSSGRYRYRWFRWRHRLVIMDL